MSFQFRSSYPSFNHASRVNPGAMVGLIICMALGTLGFNLWYSYGTNDEINIKVKDKGTIVTSSGSGEDTRVSSKYLIYTDKEVLENTDSYLRGKFDSSDLYNDLKEDQSYKCKVYGKRVPFLSWYRNILSCKQL